jgi:hypothetical protein
MFLWTEGVYSKMVFNIFVCVVFNNCCIYLFVNCFFAFMFVRGLNDDMLGWRAAGDQKDQDL